LRSYLLLRAYFKAALLLAFLRKPLAKSPEAFWREVP
jgi:hypothetical protein